MKDVETVIVTRHPALVDYLLETGVVPEGTPVISHATPEQIRDKHVVGVLPNHLAAETASITEVPLQLAPEDRGQELSIARLREVAGEPVTYVIRTLEQVKLVFW